MTQAQIPIKLTDTSKHTNS